MQTDPRFTRHDGRVRAQAVAAFRRRHRRTRAARLAALTSALIILAFNWQPRPAKVIELAAPNIAPPVVRPSLESVTLLSDDQLLALFPPGTCYIAEVSGKKRLVFRSEEMRTKYLN